MNGVLINKIKQREGKSIKAVVQINTKMCPLLR